MRADDDDEDGCERAEVVSASLTWRLSVNNCNCASLTDDLNVITWLSDWRVRILSDMLYVVRSRVTLDTDTRKYCVPSNRNVVAAADIRQKHPSLSGIFNFYRASYASTVLAVIVCLSVRPSVRLSVTSRSCTKMAKPRITLRTAYDSAGTLVFRCQKSGRNSNDITPNGSAK